VGNVEANRVERGLEDVTMVRTMKAALLVCICAGMALLGTACSSLPVGAPNETQAMEVRALENETPLGGEALWQRKLEMQRALTDMIAFRTTFESMHDRKDERDLAVLRAFSADYMNQHLNPMIAPEWQSTHPELIVLDANLRFVQAEVLIEMGADASVRAALKELVRRYDGRGNMLVDYPIGTQTTLREALHMLKQRNRRG
jgi:hypothetical protein